MLCEFRHWKRALLYIYDSEGALFYQEILPDAGASIRAVALNGSEVEAILVGGMGKVWKYRAVGGR